MSVMRDGQGRAVVLGSEIGRGGEAVIWTVAGRPELVAKIWHQPATSERAGKLAAMLADPPEDPSAARGHISIPWPTSPVTDETGALRGFLMPRLGQGKPLFEVFNPVRRRQTAPGWDERYLYRAARNLASVVEAIHRKGYVIGDLNESNVLVAPTALVSVVDTDSFQVRAAVDGREVVYPCRVGKPEYVAPELQGKPLATTVRTPAMDRFALAVLIFQLLTDGNHPFRLRWTGGGEQPSLEQSISRNLYPHGGDAAQTAPIAPPPGMLPVTALDPALQALFERAFVAGHDDPDTRPSAEEWATTLAAAEGALVRCPNGHYHDRRNAGCPECAAEAALAAARKRGEARMRSGATKRRATASAAPLPPTAVPPGTPTPPTSAGSSSRQPPFATPGSAHRTSLPSTGPRTSAGSGGWRANPPSWSASQSAANRNGQVLAWAATAALDFLRSLDLKALLGLVSLVVFGLLGLANVIDEPGSSPARPATRAPATISSAARATSTATARKRAEATTVARALADATAAAREPAAAGAGTIAGPVLFEEGFRDDGVLPADGAGTVAVANGAAAVRLGSSWRTTATLDHPFDPTGSVAIDADVGAVSAGGYAVLGVRQADGRAILLEADPQHRRWQVVVQTGRDGYALPGGGEAARFPAEAKRAGRGVALELRIVDGVVRPMIDGVEVDPGQDIVVEGPVRPVIGVARSSGRAEASFDFVRVRELVPVPRSTSFFADFAEPTPPRLLDFGAPGLSGQLGAGRLLLTDADPARWPAYAVGPVVAAETAVVEAELGLVQGGQAVLLLEGEDGRNLRILVLPMLRRWSYEVMRGDDRLAGGDWQTLPGEGGPIASVGIRRTPSGTSVLLDGEPVAGSDGVPISFSGPFRVKLGVRASGAESATAEFRSLRIDAEADQNADPSIAVSPAPTAAPTPPPGAATQRFVEDFAEPNPAEDLFPGSGANVAGHRGGGTLFLHASADNTASWRWDQVVPDGDVVAEAHIAELGGEGVATLAIATVDDEAAVMIDLDTNGQRWRAHSRGDMGTVRLDPWVQIPSGGTGPIRVGLRVADGFVSARVGSGDWREVGPKPQGFAGPFAAEVSVTTPRRAEPPAEVRVDRLEFETTAPPTQAAVAGGAGGAPTVMPSPSPRPPGAATPPRDRAPGPRTVLFNEDFLLPSPPEALRFETPDQVGSIGGGRLAMTNGNPGSPAMHALPPRFEPAGTVDVEAYITPAKGPGAARLELRTAAGDRVTVRVDAEGRGWAAQVDYGDGRPRAASAWQSPATGDEPIRRFGLRVADGVMIPLLDGAPAAWPAGWTVPEVGDAFTLAVGVDHPSGQPGETRVVFTGVLVRGDGGDGSVSSAADVPAPRSGAPIGVAMTFDQPVPAELVDLGHGGRQSATVGEGRLEVRGGVPNQATLMAVGPTFPATDAAGVRVTVSSVTGPGTVLLALRGADLREVVLEVDLEHGSWDLVERVEGGLSGQRARGTGTARGPMHEIGLDVRADGIAVVIDGKPVAPVNPRRIVVDWPWQVALGVRYEERATGLLGIAATFDGLTVRPLPDA